MRFRLEFFRNLKLLTKFQIAIFFVSTLIQGLIAFTSYYQGKSLLEEKSLESLQILTRNKKKEIENYFQNTRNQLLGFSQSPNTIDAMRKFSEAFDQVNKEVSGYEVANMLNSVKDYYETEYLHKLSYNSLLDFNIKKYLPVEKNTLALQYEYISNNSNPVGYKYKLNRGQINHAYNEVHEKYHQSLYTFLQNLGFYDILFIDMKGNVVYSVAKEPDFGTNFITGVFKNSLPALSFQNLIKKESKEEIIFTDFEHYYPSHFEPTAFLGISIYDGEKKIGVLMAQINVLQLDAILTNNLQWEKDGLGKTGEINLFGQDFKIRSNTRSILSDPLSYIERLQKSNTDTLIIERIKRMKTTVLLRRRSSRSIIKALEGKSGIFSTTDFVGNTVIDIYAPIQVFNTSWAIITQVDADELYASVYNFRNQLIIISLIIFIFQAILGYYFAKGLSDPLRKIRDDIILLAGGGLPRIREKVYKDELGEIRLALNTLVENTKEVTDFAASVGRENYDYQFRPKSKKDILGQALLEMRNNLKKVSGEDEIRTWLNAGKSLFGDILRENTENLADISQIIVSQLVKYVGASQGAVFLWNEEKQVLSLTSAYAYDRYKYLEQDLRKGEGLIGQSFQEGAPFYILDIPENYAQISFGMGDVPPKSLLITPIKNEQAVYGVIEIASLEIMEPFKVQFIEDIAESTARSIANARSNEQTQKLLVLAEQNSQKLRHQEELLRRNLLELQETQSLMLSREMELESSKVELEEQNKKLKSSETVMRKAFNRMRIQEKELKNILELQQEQEEELRKRYTELQAAQEDMKNKQSELERSKKELEISNQKLSANEEILKKALLKNKDLEKTLKKEIQEKDMMISDLESQVRQFLRNSNQ